LASLISAAAFAGQPFNTCKYWIDDQGFIVVEDEMPSRRFFPIASFFYPIIGPIMDPGDGGDGTDGTVADHYSEFSSWGGNCVICPWDITHWPYGPGAMFDTSTTCGDHLHAAYFANVKLIADPSLFWGRDGCWPYFDQIVDDNTRQQWFNMFKGWCEDGYASALLGYWQWHAPAWCLWNYEGSPARPAAEYLVHAYNHLRYTLEGGAGAHHAVFMGQAGAVKVQELWRDYFKGSECAAGAIFPCPAPATLEQLNADHHYLPNYYCSVVGDLADAVQEAARGTSPAAPAPRNQPYIAILQGDVGEDESSEHQYRFMAYDAIIHGAKGIAWFEDEGSGTAGGWYWPGKVHFLPLIQHLRRMENEYGLLTADYDSPLVRVITKLGQDEVERSAFVGGKLVPKSHFLASTRIMEGCAKISEFQGHNYTFLIVACRVPPPEGSQPVFQVEFYPYYSAYQYDQFWEGPVYKWDAVWPHEVMPLTEGKWTDMFSPEDVNIYYFEKPAPWLPE
jgi:hypothetical protein